jgi:hypothetical protein
MSDLASRLIPLSASHGTKAKASSRACRKALAAPCGLKVNGSGAKAV